MSSHVFLVSVLLPSLLFVGRICTNHTCVGSFLKFGHITGEIFTTSESLFTSTDGVFGSRSAVTSYLDIVFDRAFKNSAEFLSNDPLSSLLGWSLHKNGRLHDGRLNNLTLHSFIESRIRHCGIFILWSRLLVLTLNGKPARNSYHPRHN